MTFAPIPWLDPARVTLSRDPRGLTLTVEGRVTPGLTPVRAFPQQAPGGCVALRDVRGLTVALIEEASGLDPGSRDALAGALTAMEFSPEVHAVESLTYDDGSYEWRVRTAAGPRSFHTRQTWSALPVTRGAAGEVVILGDDGVRYRIPDLTALDARSVRLLFSVI